jgi:diketogulonate reductase-like aldo/keto reductase
MPQDTPPLPQGSATPTFPPIGFGTYPLRGRECVTAVRSAIEAGYRLIDTAVNYGNEAEVGEGIRTSGVPREEILVTTKIPGRDHAYADAVASIRGSAERLGLDYVDLHLIHWPNPRVGKYVEAYQALVDMRAEGLVRSVGVSNFAAEHLHRIIDATGVIPVMNQIEMHPWFPQEEMRATHGRLGIITEAWSPLGKRRAPFAKRAVTGPAEKYGVTSAQVILRWHLELGSLPIPKSGDPERQRQNLDVTGFSLTADEVAAITALGRSEGRLFGGDPDHHEEM